MSDLGHTPTMFYAVEAGGDGWFVMRDHPIQGEPVLSGCTEKEARDFIAIESVLQRIQDRWVSADPPCRFHEAAAFAALEMVAEAVQAERDRCAEIVDATMAAQVEVANRVLAEE